LEFTRQLKQQEKQENWRKCKELKRVTICQQCDTIPRGRMHCFDIEENVSRWPKCDTIWGNPNLVFCYTRWKRVTIYLKRDRIWANLCANLRWSLFQKQGRRILESKVRFWDLKTTRRTISSTFYQFMYVLIPLLIMLLVNSIMSS